MPAHNLIRLTAALGDLIEADETLVVASTVHTRYFAVPVRLVNRSGHPTWRMPTQWPWRVKFSHALTNLGAVAFEPT